ncbi:uncharacterized protein G2W53_015378 [Senna tora]|uniref:Uncharacterized protein n=1 Tax=Senna tora TaxID=362788 RepID=A0A834WUP2_9FABA|nr:uncharacterized protein G2W53_015378 [Senna tora]
MKLPGLAGGDETVPTVSAIDEGCPKSVGLRVGAFQAAGKRSNACEQVLCRITVEVMSMKGEKPTTRLTQ